MYMMCWPGCWPAPAAEKDPRGNTANYFNLHSKLEKIPQRSIKVLCRVSASDQPSH